MAFGPNQLQIAIFPIVCYWRNEEGEVKKGTIIFNSDDLRHDNQQIRNFLKLGVEAGIDEILDLEKISRGNGPFFSISSWRIEFSFLEMFSNVKILKKNSRSPLEIQD